MAYAGQAVIAVVTIYLLYYIRNFTRNIIDGRTTGLPMIIIPLDQTHFLWRLWASGNRDRFQRIIPRQVWDRLKLTLFGWEFDEKLKPFERFAKQQGNVEHDGEGLSFSVVGTKCLEIWTADPVAVHDVLHRAHDFGVSYAIQFALGQFGPNVMTTNGELWTRHRRMTSAVMNDHFSKSMFKESIKKTRRLLADVKHSSLFPGKPVDENQEILETSHLFDMLKKVTFHTIFAAGMGVPVAWKDEDEMARDPGYKMTFLESMDKVRTNISGGSLLPTGLLNKWPRWMPGHGKMTSIGCAKMEITERTRLILQRELASSVIGQEETPRWIDEDKNIVKSFIQTNEELTRSGAALSEDEMHSNLIMLSLAGFETTSTTLGYAVVLLARFPNWQTWLLEEVDELTAADDEAMEETWDYTSVFPRAVRMMAFMLETLRLYGPVSHLRRETASPQVLQTAKGAVPVPADASIYVNTVAIHLLPVWRGINHASDPPFYRNDSAAEDGKQDEYVFRPSRWLNPPEKGRQGIYIPPQGTWIAWSAGPRVCPGKKLSQIEFTAIMLTLLQRYRLEPVPLEGESPTEVEERLDATLCDSSWQVVLQMNRVYDAPKNGGLLMRLRKRR
ncbi:hypothetical protein E4U43_004591 [Claviceps pusilla]|uniref:Cytochrome P450 n=1 Tax=Claviceps pusilla TaxID=123648 RepID=A0A9P7N5X7_9HYPO|nr:hypothetical protein E4U43_004591 [Claviceps pusilla]